MSEAGTLTFLNTKPPKKSRQWVETLVEGLYSRNSLASLPSCQATFRRFGERCLSHARMSRYAATGEKVRLAPSCSSSAIANLLESVGVCSYFDNRSAGFLPVPSGRKPQGSSTTRNPARASPDCRSSQPIALQNAHRLRCKNLDGEQRPDSGSMSAPFRSGAKPGARTVHSPSASSSAVRSRTNIVALMDTR
ncbi:hypothetical protein B0G82_7423 [Paraburkholderia sp. BL17N1]|nr:hypothetical protein B0G82_7423 [Paraburkholderia sp. BL17N1]